MNDTVLFFFSLSCSLAAKINIYRNIKILSLCRENKVVEFQTVNGRNTFWNARRSIMWYSFLVYTFICEGKWLMMNICYIWCICMRLFDGTRLSLCLQITSNLSFYLFGVTAFFLLSLLSYSIWSYNLVLVFNVTISHDTCKR